MHAAAALLQQYQHQQQHQQHHQQQQHQQHQLQQQCHRGLRAARPSPSLVALICDLSSSLCATRTRAGPVRLHRLHAGIFVFVKTHREARALRSDVTGRVCPAPQPSRGSHARRKCCCRQHRTEPRRLRLSQGASPQSAGPHGLSEDGRDKDGVGTGPGPPECAGDKGCCEHLLRPRETHGEVGLAQSTPGQHCLPKFWCLHIAECGGVIHQWTMPALCAAGKAGFGFIAEFRGFTRKILAECEDSLSGGHCQPGDSRLRNGQRTTIGADLGRQWQWR
ncbi:unnamed protein product [Lampetra fluviatilis]